MIQRRQLSLKAADGTLLFATDWLLEPAPGARAGIVLMHGLGDHSDRYEHIVRFFNDMGISVRTYDHRGHGRSSGARGDVPDNNAILQDAQVVIDDFACQFATPLLLFGESMGGLFAARYATAGLSPLRGVILSSPALAVSLTLAQKLLLEVMSRIAPGLGVPNGLQMKYLSHDPTVEAAYVKDALVHSRISARLVRSILAAVEFSQSHAGALTVPVLLLVAGDDRLVDTTGSDTFFRQLAPGIGTMHRYDGFYHEIFNEVESVRAFEDVRAWLGQALALSPDDRYTAAS